MIALFFTVSIYLIGPFTYTEIGFLIQCLRRMLQIWCSATRRLIAYNLSTF